MRIVFASYPTVMMRHGGPKTQIIQTKKYLSEMGIHVEFLDMWPTDLNPNKWDLFHLFGSTIGNYDLAAYLSAHHIKYVISPIFFTRRSPRTIRTVSSIDHFMRHIARGTWSAYGITGDICRGAKKILPNTQDEANLISEGFGISQENIHMIPNGVEERFANADPELFYKKYGIKDFILNVGHIGRDRKNVLGLVKALKDIDHPAVIIGKVTPSKEAELTFQEADKNKNITIIEGLSHDSDMLASAYAASKVFVLPAKYETPGIAALEAGLAGANVVITKYGGTKEYFGDLATYVDPYSVESIKRGILHALEHKTNDKLKSHIQQNFLWDKVAKKTLEVYHTIFND